jgi:hypothetical protein
MTGKYFLYAIATLSVVACSNNEDNLYTTDPVVAAGEQIALNISSASDIVSVSSKGTGTVGDTEESGKNSWNGEIIRVYMFNKGTLVPSSVSAWKAVGSELIDDPEASTFYNTEVVTPKPTDDTPISTGIAQRKDNKICYYPLRGASDFWGYYLDDADVVLDAEGNKKVDENGNYVRNAPVADGEQMYIPFQIDGTQDILTGQTLEKDDAGNTEFYTSKGIEAGELYSAKAARHDVQPTLKFRHKLARLTFTARAMFAEDGVNNTERIAVTEVTANDEVHKLAVADAGGDGSHVWNIPLVSLPCIAYHPGCASLARVNLLVSGDIRLLLAVALSRPCFCRNRPNALWLPACADVQYGAFLHLLERSLQHGVLCLLLHDGRHAHFLSAVPLSRGR